MRGNNPDSWKIASLPFVWSALESPENEAGLPDSLPFELGFDKKTGLIIQKHNHVVEAALNLAYEQGSVLSGLMDEGGIGQSYAEDFLAFILGYVGRSDLKGLKILEVGCGNGYLLKRLQEHGAEVIGIEPGQHGQEGAKKWGIPIVHGIFPHDEVQEQFDLVISFAVLEHINNPTSFLSQLKSNLTPEGAVIISVPDVEPYVEAGDLSILLHEHWSYFDSVTLSSTIKLAGYKERSIEKSSFGGSLYSAMTIDSNVTILDSVTMSQSIQRACKYIQTSKENSKKFISFCDKIRNENKTLGIYVPFRAVNILKLSEMSIDNIRFFDDNALLLGTYYPGINVPVESGEALREQPTDYVLIMSMAFGDGLAKKLNVDLPPNTIIRTISQVLS